MEETIFSTEEYIATKERRTCPAHAQGSNQPDVCKCYEVIVLTKRPESEFRERVIKRLQREIVERKELLFGMGIPDWRQEQ